MRSAAFDDWTERAREADIMAVAEKLGAQLKRAGREYVGPCPACGGTDRFSINPSKRIFNCRGARGGDVIAMVEHVLSLKFVGAVEWITGEKPPSGKGEVDHEALRAVEARRREADRKNAAREQRATRHKEFNRTAAYRIWMGAEPLAGTPAERYLRYRGIDFDLAKMPLRCARALPYPEDDKPIERWAKHPALICGVTGADRRFRGVWRIYVAADGQGKADVPEAKLGLGPCVGGAVWLGPISSTKNVCEGLETGLGILGLLHGRETVAATLSTSGMINFEPPPETTFVRIWPDADPDRTRYQDGRDRFLPSPGQRSAETLRDKLIAANRLAMVQRTPPIGKDYLDIYLAQKRVEDGQTQG